MEKLIINLYVFSLLLLVLVTSNANVNPEVYWKPVLPNTPMPKALKNILYSRGLVEEKVSPDREKLYAGMNLELIPWIYYGTPASEEQVSDGSIASFFFLDKYMHKGGQLKLVLNKKLNPEAKLIVSRHVADSVPFSSDKLSKIYKHFSIDPNSMEARVIKDTIGLCEKGALLEGEKRYCATSLESMLDFVTSTLGNKVKVVSTEEEDDAANSSKEKTTSLPSYKIEGVKKLASGDNINNVVVCHKLNYPYAVFGCHQISNTRAYAISLVNPIDGTKVKAISMCHDDTSKWNPEHLAFQVLKVTPGSIPVCHFVGQESLVWVPY